MDDYNTNTLSEAKSEYSERLVSILTPPIIQGFKSIFDEALKLCLENDEDDKYLMTFQNFLTRVPKWNQEIINLETKRIIETSKCHYLEDLLTCVHITQLKILTSIRVSSKQKKIDLDIPKLFDFIHKVYIVAARKIYQNVYLFEKNILPLQQQKHMRECELLIKESIISVIRETMPIENILRAYIDETEEEEIIEEKFVKKEKDIKQDDDKENEKEDNKKEDKEEDKEDKEKDKKDKKDEKDESINIVKNNETPINDNTDTSPQLIINEKDTVSNSLSKTSMLSEPPTIPSNETSVETEVSTKESSDVMKIPVSPPPSISFNDTDNVLEFKNKDLPGEINKVEPEKVNAPKTIERLEKISTERHNQRKLDELEEDDEEDDDGLEKIQIMSDSPKVDLNIQVLDKPIKLNTKPELTGIEILE